MDHVLNHLVVQQLPVLLKLHINAMIKPVKKTQEIALLCQLVVHKHQFFVKLQELVLVKELIAKDLKNAQQTHLSDALIWIAINKLKNVDQ